MPAQVRQESDGQKKPTQSRRLMEQGPLFSGNDDHRVAAGFPLLTFFAVITGSARCACEPVAPVYPVEPVSPVAPVAPVAPVGPGTATVEPVLPVAPVAPVGPAGPGTTTTGDGAAGLTVLFSQAAKPSVAITPAKSIEYFMKSLVGNGVTAHLKTKPCAQFLACQDP